MLYRSEGIVIRAMDYGETHKIITLFTNNVGKVGILVKGAKKVRSKHASLAQPFTYGEFVFTRQTGLGNLQHGEIIESHHLLRENLDLSAHAAYITELTEKAIPEEEVNHIHFQLLKHCFLALQTGKDFEVISQIYQMKLLALTGYDPVVDSCIQCGHAEGRYRMSYYAGGILCERCARGDQSLPLLSDNVLKLLRFYKQVDLSRIGQINISTTTKAELTQVIHRLIDYQLGLKLKSRAFLEILSKLN